MDLKVLEYLVMIARCGNISKAAEKLYISQSGLNQQVLKVEKSLGLKLFDRDQHHFQITRAGKIYIKNAAAILRIQRNTFTQLNDLKQDIRGEISMGLTHEHGIDLFTSVYPSFHKKYPNMAFSLVEKVVKEQYRMLEENTLDLGIVLLKGIPAAMERDYQFIRIYHEDLLLGIPLDHPLADRAVPINSGKPLRVIDLNLFKDDPFALIFESSTMRQNVIDPMMRKIGFVPHIMLETAMNSALALLVSKGLCCTILPHSRALASSYKEKCAWFRLLGNPVWSVAFVHRKDYRMGDNLRDFIQLAQKYGREMEEKFETESPHYKKGYE